MTVGTDQVYLKEVYLKEVGKYRFRECISYDAPSVESGSCAEYANFPEQPNDGLRDLFSRKAPWAAR